MIHTLLCPLVSILLLPAALRAETVLELTVPQLKQAETSVVLVSRKDRGGCGTGFFMRDGRLLTSLHLVDGACAQGECSQLQLKRGTLGNPALSEIAVERITLEYSLPLSDIAVLSLRPPQSGVFTPPSGLLPQRLFTLGFPGCSALALSEGGVRSTGSLHLRTEASGGYGSSGSPVFDSSLQLQGVADEAATIQEALLSRLSGGRFPLRAARADVALSLLAPSDSRLTAHRQKELLLEFYQNEVAPFGGLLRLQNSSHLVQVAPSVISLLTAQERQPLEDLVKHEHEHIIALALTTPILNRIRAALPKGYQEMITMRGVDDDAHRIVNSVLLAVLVVILATALWAFALGSIFSRLNRSWGACLAITCLIAITGPLAPLIAIFWPRSRSDLPARNKQG